MADWSGTATGEAPARALGLVASWEQLRRRHAAVALGLYVAAALLIERDAVAHLGSVCACNGGADPAQFMWALKWFPHAIVHGLNPFFTRVMWAPDGLNLASGTSVPTAALIAWPLTAAAGPLATFNVLTLAAPVLGAWFAYRLCLYVTRAPGASIAGGYLYGFSSYELSHMVGLLHTEFTFALPLLVLLALKRLDERIGATRYLAQTAVVLIVQLGLSTELTFTMTCIGAVSLGIGWLVADEDRRRRIVALLVPLAGAYLVMALVWSPYLYYALRGTPYTKGWDAVFSADALGFLIPTQITSLGGHRFAAVSSTFLGDPTENGTYLGLPLALIMASFAIQWWRTRTGKLITLTAGVAALWSLGPRLLIAGHRTIWLPWSLFRHLPLFDQLVPVRGAVFVALAVALAAAIWLAAPSARTWMRWLVVVLAVAFLIPDTGTTYSGTGRHLFHAPMRDPSLFATDLYRRYLRPDEVVLPLPSAQHEPALLWQAQDGFYFRIATGYFTAATGPGSYAGDPFAAELSLNSPGPAAASQLKAFISLHRVSTVAMDPAAGQQWMPVVAKLGLRPHAAGGMLLYTVPRAWSS